jgi:hypothetical protein
MGKNIVLVVSKGDASLAESFVRSTLEEEGFGVETRFSIEGAGFELAWGRASLVICFQNVRGAVVWAERMHQTRPGSVVLLLRPREKTSSDVPAVRVDAPGWETGGREVFLGDVRNLLPD